MTPCGSRSILLIINLPYAGKGQKSVCVRTNIKKEELKNLFIPHHKINNIQ